MQKLFLTIISVTILCSVNTSRATDHNVTEETIVNQFRTRGFVIDKCHTDKELTKIQYLIDVIQDQGDRDIAQHHRVGKAFISTTITNPVTNNTTQMKGIETKAHFVFGAYKIHKDILSFSQKTSVGRIVTTLLDDDKNEIIHTRNDLVWDSWTTYKRNFFEASRSIVDSQKG